MTTKTDLKSFFETGDKPTQGQFYEWMDSYWHKDESPQIKINSTAEITNQTKATNGYTQNGKNVLIDNGSAAINYKINLTSDTEENFLITGIKLGTAAITFTVGSGSPVLTKVDNTLAVNGTKGSRFMISRVGNTNEFLIFINNL
ncbi:hypothetical protein J2X97_003132 [Epilithonimonas hungarica]|uniref:hypothetical protein n=1 Tax=Epilithonimonas hungarica TaxID=454006 RepID=UPI002783AC5E|nr:hypothetical protein [Epilithonimonas hungarica]MDP9957463.1 hypothetical protein [Epilithonimonas hungarica]